MFLITFWNFNNWLIVNFSQERNIEKFFHTMQKFDEILKSGDKFWLSYNSNL